MADSTGLIHSPATTLIPNHPTNASTPTNDYTYDKLDRLTQADYLVGIQTEDEQFTYDLLGNRQTVNLRSGADQVYSINNTNNQYTAIDAASVSHDLAGNLTTGHRGYQYQYDQDNRLTQLKQGTAALVAGFTTDALGRRIEKIEYVPSPSPNITTRYTYDGWRVLTETDQADLVQRDYLYGNYIDEAVMMIDADDHYYAHDHLFSVVALLDDTGDVIERYEYNAYGKATVYTDDGADDIWFTSDDTTADTSAQGNPYTFTGQRLDTLDSDAFQIMYYKNRYYDTETGRFLQRDPLGVQDGLNLLNYNNLGKPNYDRRFNPIVQYANGINIYEYVLSRPVIYKDPQGLLFIQNPISSFGDDGGVWEDATGIWGIFSNTKGWMCGEYYWDKKPKWKKWRITAPKTSKGTLPVPPVVGIGLEIVGGVSIPTEPDLKFGKKEYKCICYWRNRQSCRRCCKVPDNKGRFKGYSYPTDLLWGNSQSVTEVLTTTPPVVGGGKPYNKCNCRKPRSTAPEICPKC